MVESRKLWFFTSSTRQRWRLIKYSDKTFCLSHSEGTVEKSNYYVLPKTRPLFSMSVQKIFYWKIHWINYWLINQFFISFLIIIIYPLEYSYPTISALFHRKYFALKSELQTKLSADWICSMSVSNANHALI